MLLISLPVSAQYLTGDRNRESAEPAEPDFFGYENLPFERDRGTLLRLTLAPTWATTRTRPRQFAQSDGLRIEGGGLELSAALGSVLRPGLALHGAVSATALLNPTVSSGSASREAADLGLIRVGFGPGVTGYLPSNVWGSVSLGGSILMIDFVGDEDLVAPSLGYGLYFEAAAGKEWWLNGYGSVGIFGKIATHRVTTDYVEPIGGASISLVLSATFN